MNKIIPHLPCSHKVHLLQNHWSKTQHNRERKSGNAKFISWRGGEKKEKDRLRKNVHTSRKYSISAILSWQIKSSVISMRPQNWEDNIFKNMYPFSVSLIFAYSPLNIFSAPMSQILKILCIRMAFVIPSCFSHSPHKKETPLRDVHGKRVKMGGKMVDFCLAGNLMDGLSRHLRLNAK